MSTDYCMSFTLLGLLIKGSRFDLVSHVGVKCVHKTKCNEWMENRIRSQPVTNFLYKIVVIYQEYKEFPVVEYS